MNKDIVVPRLYQGHREELFKKIGKEKVLLALQNMSLIRNFETRAESAYLQGKIGGFFHAYIGQEAIQTAAVMALGVSNWWTTSYRCHALALLLGATPYELMAELYGKATGNAKGRGGSMHFYTDRLLGGFGIVGGQIPIALGAAFSLKYQEKKNEVSTCFMGEGAVAQGVFHESMNLASLWSLPAIFVIENNKWGMGTAAERALVNKRIAEEQALSYKMKGYTFDGMDFLDSFYAFSLIHEEVLKTGRPVLLEAITERFRGHSISDPGLYRTKEHVKAFMEKDPITQLLNDTIKMGWITEEEFKVIDKENKEKVLAAMTYADESPWPDVETLGKEVFAPESDPQILYQGDF